MFDKISYYLLGHAQAATSSTDLWNTFNGVRFFGGGAIEAESTAQKLITIFTTWLLAIAAVIAFAYLVFSGINYITAGGDADKATKARTGILNAIIGIAVITLAFVIIRVGIGIGAYIGGRV